MKEEGVQSPISCSERKGIGQRQDADEFVQLCHQKEGIKEGRPRTGGLYHFPAFMIREGV